MKDFFSKEEKHSVNLKFDEIKNDFNRFENNPKQNIEVIFDTNSFSFREIIAFMEKQKANNLTFKDYVANSEFLIGSNHANDIGQVINLTKID